MVSERWFTPEQGNDLAVRSASFTPVELSSLAAIHNFAVDPLNSDRELLHCLDNAGTRVIDMSTGYKAADLTDTMRSAIREGYTRLWHNHPSRGSLSHADWNLAACTERTEILASTTSGTIFVGRMMNWSDAFDAVMGESFCRIAAELDTAMQAYSSSNNVFTERDLSAHLDGHIINLTLAACGVVRYAASLSNLDASALDAAASVGLLAEAMDWATRRIRHALKLHA